MMSDSARNEPMTRFLMYKISIRGGDTESAAECLQAICSASRSSQDSTLLYACVLDAQDVGSKTETLRALQAVLENSEVSTQIAVHLPSLLRLTIGLMVAILDEDPVSQSAISTIERICFSFEKGEYNLLSSGYPLIWNRCCCCPKGAELVERSRSNLDG